MSLRSTSARIAFISTLDGTPWGGSEVLWHRAAKELLSRGHCISTNTQWWPRTPEPLLELQKAGGEITFRRTSTLRRIAGRIAPPLRHRDETWLDSVKPDLILITLHCHAFGLEWMRACAQRNIPYAVLIEAVVDHYWCGDARQKPLAKAYNEAAGLYFVSEGNRRQVSIQLADALSSAEVVRNPFNVSYDVQLLWPQDMSTLRLACVARIDPGNKGQDILLEVLAQSKWRDRDVTLTLFGDGPHKTSVLALIKYFGLQSQVAYGGYTNNIEDVWKTHHALVLASRAEGLPLAVVEAMLCGRPCVVTDVAGNAELIEDNVSGFVAAAPKPEFLDEALERLWQKWQKQALQQCGEAAAQQVRKQVPANPAAVFADKLESLL